MQIKIFVRAWTVLVSGFLALLISASAFAQVNRAPLWRTDHASGFGSCYEALNEFIAFASQSGPLIITGPDCDQAAQPGGFPGSNFQFVYRRVGQSFDDQTNVSAYCLDSPVVDSATDGIYCISSQVLRNIGFCPTCVGNPIQPGFGNKIHRETDYVGTGPFPLRFERSYNSARGFDISNVSGLNANWTHGYARTLGFSGTTTEIKYASVTRPDGKILSFVRSAPGSSIFNGDGDVNERLVRLASSWQLTTPNDEIETYDNDGRLVSIANRAGLVQTVTHFTSGVNIGLVQTVTDPFGRALIFAYTNRLLTTMTIPGGGIFTFGYASTAAKQFNSLIDPLGKVRTYHYELANPRLLTGITDELGQRLATYGYNASSQASSSEHAGSAGKVTVNYSGGTNVTTFVSATQSATRTYTFTTLQNLILNTGISGPACPECGPKETRYNPNGTPNYRGDWNDNVHGYTYDARNQEITDFGPYPLNGQQQPETVYFSRSFHPTFRLLTEEAAPLRRTTLAYDPDGSQCGARGALCSKTVQATNDPNGIQFFGSTLTGTPRTWTYTYNSNGQVLTANGPRTDVTDNTAYTYYANNDADINKRGNVATITNALGHTTQITAYNEHGQPLTIVDPNGLTTTLTYDGRQRLTSRDVGGELTTYTYDNAGQLTKVTLPDSSFLSYSYDAAHRLTGIQDNQGNRIAYTLDFAGNRTQEQVFDPANALAQTRSRVYSNINRLFQELGALNQTTEYTYDLQGNVLTVKDPLNHTSTNQYDRRYLLKQVTDPATGVTKYSYNGLDALIQVTDPRNLVTGYTVDGLGNLNQQASPDTGNTVNTYDAAGNLATQTDAKSQVTTYAYDALNRVSLITFHDGSTQAYAYDLGTNGVGRLTSITETNPASQVTSLIAYGYDQKGRVTSETRTVNGVPYTLAYSYDGSGRLTGMTYPSGRTVTYTLDALGRVAQVTTTKDSQQQVVAQNIQYHPFGGAKSWTLGNGQIYSRTIDLDGRIASYTLGATNNAISFDAASRITGIATNTYGYDTLDRLTSAILPSSNFAYSYDGVGNRMTKTVGANTDTYTYSATSNRIATLTPSGSPPRSFVLDANGSTTNDALNTYVYDTRGRMVQSTNSAATVTTYQVNALGQRIRKTNANEDRVFTYDTWGKVIAETDPGGVVKREFIYLGDIPVGVVQ